jgi:hypothetical protein
MRVKQLPLFFKEISGADRLEKTAIHPDLLSPTTSSTPKVTATDAIILHLHL